LTTLVALLRAINLGEGTRLQMSEFRELLKRLGFENPRTVLQTGNAVFETTEDGAREVARRIETALRAKQGLETRVLLRSGEEWRSILHANPFPQEAIADPAHLVVAVLQDEPSAAAWTALRASIVGREKLSSRGREAFLYYPDGIGHSRLTQGLIDTKLGTFGTSRNWNTVQKIGEACSVGRE
jgi:uncharacterized protein (DUF1697 family)